MKTCYGRTGLEKIEELVIKWMNFRDDDFDDENNLLQAMLEIQRRKDNIEVLDREWYMVSMLKKVHN